MAQCLTCISAVMVPGKRGMAVCRGGADPAIERDVEVVWNCALWALGAMAQVRARSQRRMTFNNNGVATLS